MKKFWPVIFTFAIVVAFLLLTYWSSDPQEANVGRLPNTQNIGRPAGENSGTQPTGSAGGRATRTPATPVVGANGMVMEMVPLIYLTAASATYEAALTLSGQGFEPGEDIRVILDADTQRPGTELGWVSADKQGAFGGFTFSLGWEVKPGEHYLTAEGQSSGGKAQTVVNLQTGYPWVNPSTYTGKPNGTVDFKGGSFIPGESVLAHFESLNDPAVAKTKADQYGNLTMTGVPIPFATEGNHLFVIVGEQSNAPTNVPFTVLGFYPWVALDPYTPRPQQSVGFIGQDFAPNEPVQVFLNGLGKHPIAMVYSDAKGHFEASSAFEIPLELAGKNSFSFLGQKSGKPVSVDFNVLPLEPIMELTTYAGKPGTMVGFVGSGYARGERIRAYLGKGGNQEEVSIFESGADGSVKDAGHFAVPKRSTAGALSIIVVGDQSKAPVKLSFEVIPFAPVALLSEYAGPPGKIVRFSGLDFAPGEQVDVYLKNGDASPVATAVADENGEFSEAGAFSIPAGVRTDPAFSFQGKDSGATATVAFKILVEQAQPSGEEQPQAPAPLPTPSG